MENENKNKIAILEGKVKKLEDFVASLNIAGMIPKSFVEALITRGFLAWDGDISFEGGAGGNTFNNIFIRYLNQRYLQQLPYPLKRFTAVAATNTCHSIGHGFNDGNNVTFYTTDTLPGGLDSLIETYAIYNATADTFQLTTDGVSAVDITDAGVGVQYAQVY